MKTSTQPNSPFLVRNILTSPHPIKNTKNTKNAKNTIPIASPMKKLYMKKKGDCYE